MIWCTKKPTAVQNGVDRKTAIIRPMGNCRLAAASAGLHVLSEEWYALLNSGSRMRVHIGSQLYSKNACVRTGLARAICDSGSTRRLLLQRHPARTRCDFKPPHFVVERAARNP